MPTTDPGWPEHDPHGDVHYWEYKDDMGYWRCGGCGIRKPLKAVGKKGEGNEI